MNNYFNNYFFLARGEISRTGWQTLTPGKSP